MQRWLERTAWLWLVVASCASSSRDDEEAKLTKPELDQLLALDALAACEAVAPRLAPCADELIVGTAAALDPELAGAIEAELEAAAEKPEKPAAKRREDNLAVAVNTCLGWVDRAAFLRSVLACWDEPTCPTLVTCVLGRSTHVGIGD